MNRLAASVAALFLLTGCNTLPTERQLVGTWTAPESSTKIEGITQSQSKQMVDLTLTPDHKFVWALRGRRPTAIGRWHLRGRWLISEFTTRGKGHKVNLAYPYRDRIVKISPDELIYVQGEDDPGVEVHLTRRSSEPLAAPPPSTQ